MECDIQSTLVEGIHQHTIVLEVVRGAQVLELHTAGQGDAEHQEHEKFVHFEILFHDFKRCQRLSTVEFTDRKVVPINRFGRLSA